MNERARAALAAVPNLKPASQLAQPPAKTEPTPDEHAKLALRDLIESRRLAQQACMHLGYAGYRREQADAGRAVRQISDAIASMHDGRA